MFAYCNNNPVMNVDPTGEAWGHWVLAAAVVVACVAATVVTCGGSLAGAAMAIGMVASGSAALTTASTVAAAATIGSGLALGAMALDAAFHSDSLEEFGDAGNTGTIVATTLGGLTGGGYGYTIASAQLPKTGRQEVYSGVSQPCQSGGVANSRYLQYDQATGQLRSDTIYDGNGNWYSRIDYMHTHNIGGIDTKPHIHMAPPLNEDGFPIGRELVWSW